MDAASRTRYLAALGLRDWLRPAGPRVSGSAASGVRPAPAEVRRPAAEAASVDAGTDTAARPPGSRSRGPDSERPAAAPPQQSFATLTEARECVASCTACALHSTRTQTVFGVGPDRAPLMVIGEGPGAEEDRRGEPFVGRAGQLLDAMLAAIGHARQENCYIANVVKCRPPNNRDPLAEEVEACRAYLDAQVRLIRPRLILAVGRVAAQRLLDTDQSLSRLRGRRHEYGADAVPVWVTYHPAYLLRRPHDKAKAWEDLKQVHAMLAEADGGTGQ